MSVFKSVILFILLKSVRLGDIKLPLILLIVNSSTFSVYPYQPTSQICSLFSHRDGNFFGESDAHALCLCSTLSYVRT
jgi:hypothetical protein